MEILWLIKEREKGGGGGGGEGGGEWEMVKGERNKRRGRRQQVHLLKC